MALVLELGKDSQQGPRERNEDFAGFVTPNDDVLTVKGALSVLADGVSAGGYGREAAEISVRNLLADYYATPDTWQVDHALRKLIQSVNGWLYAQSVSKHAAGGMSCTLSALVLKGSRFTIAHVGDSRVYRLRNQQLTQLTTDHVWEAAGMSHVLKRAVGLDELIQVDILEGDLQVGDMFCICCDGIWSALTTEQLKQRLLAQDTAQGLAQSCVKMALDKGSTDNCTALVVKVMDIQVDAGLQAWRNDIALPLPPAQLGAGSRLDEFEIESVLHHARETRLFLARKDDGSQWVLKTLDSRFEQDGRLRERLMMEAWLGQRIQSHYFAEPLLLPNRQFLYFAQRYYSGADVGKMLAAGHHFSTASVVTHGIRLLKAVASLHRLDILHRDIKPDNVHLDMHGKLRLLDLGVASCGLCQQLLQDEEGKVGTPSYVAPEVFKGAPYSVQTDLYAIGVTLYYMLTRHYPYGEIEPFQTPKFTEPAELIRYRPDTPAWLENAVLKAVARDERNRFETAEEFLAALEKGEFNRLERPRKMPLAERSPEIFWRVLFFISLLLNLLLLFAWKR